MALRLVPSLLAIDQLRQDEQQRNLNWNLAQLKESRHHWAGAHLGGRELTVLWSAQGQVDDGPVEEKIDEAGDEPERVTRDSVGTKPDRE